MNRRKFLSFFSAIFLVMFCFNAIAYSFIATFQKNVFASLFRMFQYHAQHPYQFILVFTFILSIGTTLFIKFFNKWNGWKKYAGIAVTFAAALAVSSLAGGLLWKIYDMQANFMPRGWQYWKDLFWGMGTGFLTGWQIVLYSFPYNLIVLAGDIAAFLYFYKPSRFKNWKDIDQS